MQKNNNNNSKQKTLFQLEGEPTKGYPIISDEERDKVLLALLSLEQIEGVGFKTLCNLFDIDALRHILDLPLNEIVNTWTNLGGKPYSEIVTHLKNNKPQLLEIGAKSLAKIKTNNIQFIPIGHKDYPETLLRLSLPPRWLFIKGNLEAIQSPSIISVIGTRSATIDGQRLAYLCSSLLTRQNIIVLSGLAKGIDEKAHLGAVDYYGLTIAVLGFGINLADSNQNRELISRIIETDGAIVSEYLPKDQGTRKSFLRRNELQAAFSKVVIPIECPSLESGTGATIRRAFKINTPVIGVINSGHSINEKNLITTKKNLEEIVISFFSLNNGGEERFWDFLKSSLPNHDWNVKPTARQTRFFQNIEKQILKEKKKLDLDQTSIGLLVERLKNII